MPFGKVVVVRIAIALKLLEMLLCVRLKEQVLLAKHDLLLERLLPKSLKKLLIRLSFLLLLFPYVV